MRVNVIFNAHHLAPRRSEGEHVALSPEPIETPIMTDAMNYAPPFRVGSGRDPADIAAAADLIAKGKTIGFCNRTVCALIGPSDTRAFADEVIRIKGEKRRIKPVAAFMFAEEIAASIDASRIPRALVPLLTEPDALRNRLQGLALLRFPLTREAAKNIPPYMLSYRSDGTPVFMGGDPTGYEPLKDLFDACRARGVKFMSGTSMNASGSPEIIDQAEGIAFTRAAGLELFLADHEFLGWPAGSPTILDIRADDVVLIRDGFLPLWILEQILGMKIGLPDDVRPARHQQLSVDRNACAAMDAPELCRHLINEHFRQRRTYDAAMHLSRA